MREQERLWNQQVRRDSNVDAAKIWARCGERIEHTSCVVFAREKPFYLFRQSSRCVRDNRAGHRGKSISGLEKPKVAPTFYEGPNLFGRFDGHPLLNVSVSDEIRSGSIIPIIGEHG